MMNVKASVFHNSGALIMLRMVHFSRHASFQSGFWNRHWTLIRDLHPTWGAFRIWTLWCSNSLSFWNCSRKIYSTSLWYHTVNIPTTTKIGPLNLKWCRMIENPVKSSNFWIYTAGTVWSEWNQAMPLFKTWKILHRYCKFDVHLCPVTWDNPPSGYFKLLRHADKPSSMWAVLPVFGGSVSLINMRATMPFSIIIQPLKGTSWARAAHIRKNASLESVDPGRRWDAASPDVQ